MPENEKHYFKDISCARENNRILIGTDENMKKSAKLWDQRASIDLEVNRSRISIRSDLLSLAVESA